MNTFTDEELFEMRREAGREQGQTKAGAGGADENPVVGQGKGVAD